MVVFPNSKINLGLHVIARRADGYHNIETVFYPVHWKDILEIIENHHSEKPFEISMSGLSIAGGLHDNLLYRAWQLICQLRKIPPILVHLHKNIPMGAGLGGGSSDAAHFIKLLDEKFELGLDQQEKFYIANQLGSDCAFFVENTPVLAAGKGNEFSNIKVNLSAYYLLLVYPAIHCSTQFAYQNLTPCMPKNDLRTSIENHPISDWRHLLMNDFETSIFKKYEEIQELKETLYQNDAIYASLSGSGSAVFGIFANEPDINFPDHYQYYLQKPGI